MCIGIKTYICIYIYIYTHIYIYIYTQKAACCKCWIDIPAFSQGLDWNLVHVHIRNKVQELDRHPCIDLGLEHTAGTELTFLYIYTSVVWCSNLNSRKFVLLLFV